MRKRSKEKSKEQRETNIGKSNTFWGTNELLFLLDAEDYRCKPFT